MAILIVDNYDSFTYNLVHYVEDLADEKPAVFRNDEISLEAVDAYHKILLSPGPGLPKEAGILNDLIKTYAQSKSILGVCLGQQAIGEVFGGKLRNLQKVYHGVATEITITDKTEPLYKGLPEKFEAARYHSWVVDHQGLPGELLITAKDENGEIMGLRHKTLDVRGVQFHPESIMTEVGKKIIENWLKL